MNAPVNKVYWLRLIADQVRTSSFNPLKLMGMSNKNSIPAIGKAADLLFLAEQLQRQKVFAGGVEY